MLIAATSVAQRDAEPIDPGARVTPILVEPSEDWYDAVVEDDLHVSGSGSGYDNGTWYYYPDSTWWRQWYRDDPYDPNRWKEIDIDLRLRPLDPDLDAHVLVSVSWATAEWSALGYEHPPLPDDLFTPDDEQLYVGCEQLLELSSLDGGGLRFRFDYTIPDYNPAWVSIGVSGGNYQITGTIIHQCIPEPASLSLLVLGSLLASWRHR